MVRMIKTLLAELDQEAQTTRRVLERVPGDKLAWKPHVKSMSLGQLALHVATNPGEIAEIMEQDSYEMSGGESPAPQSAAELVPALDQSIQTAQQIFGGWDDAKLNATWKLTQNGKAMMAVPRSAILRAFFLSHWYHHRGQLSVYLRLLDVPVPSIYGPSADENPFAGS